MDTLFPAERHLRPRVHGSTITTPPVGAIALARTWLDTERPGLVAIAAHAAKNGWPEHAMGLGATLFRYLDSGAHFPEALAMHGHARDAACQVGDRIAEATSMINLGLAHYREGHSQQAADLYQQALAQFREASDQAGQARALNSLGLVALQRRTYRGAREYFRAALTLCRTVGDRIGEVRALDYLRCAHTSTAVAHGPAVIFGRP